jgi:hypothetical protein
VSAVASVGGGWTVVVEERDRGCDWQNRRRRAARSVRKAGTHDERQRNCM